MAEGSGELHPELRERAAGDDRDVLIDACGNERGGDDEGVDRAGAEGLDVAAGSVPAARLLGDRLPEVAASTLVAVADGFLPTPDGVLKLVGAEAAPVQKVFEGQGPRGL